MKNSPALPRPRFVLLLLAALALIGAGCKKSTDARSDGAAIEAPAADTAATASAPASTGDAVLLKVQWPVGGRFVHRIEMEQNMNLPAPAAAKPNKQETSFGQDYSMSILRERPGGGREIELEFLAANLSVSMGGNEVLGFDTRGESSGDENNPAVKPLRQMIGQKLLFHLDASNNVERVDGVKEFTDKVLGQAGRGRSMMAGMFSEEYFKQMMSHGRGLPAEPVKPGATWPSRTDIQMGPLGRAALNLTYTFKGWEQHEKVRCAALDFTGTLTPGAGETNSPFAGFMQLKDGTCAGRTWFDPARGLVIDTAFRQSMGMEIKIPGMGGAPGGAVTPQQTKLDQQISIKLVEESRK